MGLITTGPPGHRATAGVLASYPPQRRHHPRPDAGAPLLLALNTQFMFGAFKCPRRDAAVFGFRLDFLMIAGCHICPAVPDRSSPV